MSKKFPGLLILFIIICLITSCGHDRSAKIELKKVTADFSALTKKVDAEAKIAATRDKKQEMLAESQEGFNNLLKRIADLPASPGLEILRAKILLRLDRLAESEQVIDSVLNSNPAADIINGARVVKVLVLIAQAKTAAAYEIFKDIDPGSLDPVDYYTALFQLALEHEDDETREKCSVQFLNAKELPVEQDGNLYIIQANLAELATIEGDLDKAKSILDEGIKETNLKSEAFFLEKQQAQLKLIGQEAPLLAANTWLNSGPISWGDGNGKVVVLFFWAPWCPHSRGMLPAVAEAYAGLQAKGVVIIGYTRYYGWYEDDLADKGKVEPGKELEYIKDFLKRQNITYPVVIGESKADYDTYQVNGLPTLVFIDVNRKIDFIKTGIIPKGFITRRINHLLEKSEGI